MLHLLTEEPILFFVWIICVVLAISIHEFSHAYAGLLEGDDTAQKMGRLTFNPLAHIDWMGLLLLVVVGFGWGKPVPFNPYNLKHKRWGPAFVAIAGPLSNLIMIVIAGVLLRILLTVTGINPDNLLIAFLILLIQINLILMLFNLVPIPPLDGSKILYSFLSYKRRNVVLFLETYGTWMLIGFIVMLNLVAPNLFSYLSNLVLRIILF